MLLDPVIERLRARTELAEVSTVVDLAALLEGKGASSHRTSAHVVGMGLRGRAPDAAAGVFRQEIEDVVAVLLSFRSIDDRAGARAIEPVSALVDTVIRALAGWAPDAVTGVFAVSRGNIVSFKPGFLVYALEFTITDQLRIAE